MLLVRISIRIKGVANMKHMFYANLSLFFPYYWLGTTNYIYNRPPFARGGMKDFTSFF